MHRHITAVQKPAQASIAADSARRATRPMQKWVAISGMPDCPENDRYPGSASIWVFGRRVGRPDKRNVNLGHSERPCTESKSLHLLGELS